LVEWKALRTNLGSGGVANSAYTTPLVCYAQETRHTIAFSARAVPADDDYSCYMYQ